MGCSIWSGRSQGRDRRVEAVNIAPRAAKTPTGRAGRLEACLAGVSCLQPHRLFLEGGETP